MSTLRREPPWKSFEGFQWTVHDDRWFVTVIPSIFIDVTRWMSVSGGGGQTVHRRRLSEKIISKDFLRFIFGLFLAAHFSICSSSASHVHMLAAYLYCCTVDYQDIIDVRSPAFTTYDAGPTADPCIKLAVMLRKCDISSLYFTQWLRPWEKSANQLWTLSGMLSCATRSVLRRLKNH